MELFRGVEIVNSFPALYLNELDLLVITDLHLGFEGIMSEEGIYLPKVQFKKTIELMEKIIEIVKAENLLINGDIKHEFSQTSYHEFKEVRDFLTFSKDNFKRVILIKGNHDNFIIHLTKKCGVELYNELRINDFYFVHGHEDKNFENINFKYLIIGHEHPSIALFDELRNKEKVKCFLYGNLDKNKKIIVIPAISYFAYGTDINLVEKEELLSPILKKLNVNDLKAVGLIEGERVLEFPEIWKLKALQFK